MYILGWIKIVSETSSKGILTDIKAAAQSFQVEKLLYAVD